jgi:hypothetical protein
MKADKTVNTVEILLDVMLSSASRRSLLLVNRITKILETLSNLK